MSGTSDKIEGKANQVAGDIKQGIGKAVGSEKLRAQGKAQELKGKGQEAIGQAKTAIKDAVKDADKRTR